MTIRYHVQATDKNRVILTSTVDIDGWASSRKGDAGTGYANPAVCQSVMTLDAAKTYMASAKQSGATIARGEDRS